jgi:hypothetical protein
MRRANGGAVLSLVIFLLTWDSAAAAGGSPIEKTVELITKLQGSLVSDGETSKAAYKKYFEWCDQSTTEKRFEVKQTSKDKVKLEAEIQRATSDAEEASGKIEELAKIISENEKKLEDTTDVRKQEASTFKDSEAKLMESIDMLGRAIEILEKESAKSASLMQSTVATSSLDNILIGLGAIIDAAGIPTEDTERLASLIQSREDSEDADGENEEEKMLGAPSAKAYDSKSGSIIEIMEDMREKAEVQLRKTREAEANAQQNYDLLKLNLEDQISNAKKDMKSEKGNKASALEKKATAQGDLDVTTKELAKSTVNLKEVQDACIEAAADYEKTVTGRNAELAALAKAKKTIQAAMAGKAASFLQTSSRSRGALSLRSRRAKASVAAGKKVIRMVKQLADEQHSQSLAQLASRLSAVVRYGSSSGEDPFKNVKSLITDMVKRLEAEMSSEAKEKAYCDSEMKKTQGHSDELNDNVEGLKSKIDSAASTTATLKTQVKELSTEIAELQRAQGNMDKARESERAAYKEATADLQRGLEGTRSAIRLLREYYATDDEDSSASLLQSDTSMGEEMAEEESGDQPKPPEKFKKSSGAGAGIIGLLEIIESDFAKNLAEEETEEASAVTEYQKLTQENKVLKTMKEKDVEYKTREIKALGSNMADLSSDYDDTSEELASLTEYFTKLKERCVAKPESYESRKARREAEIKGLQEALDILAGESSSFAQE